MPTTVAFSQKFGRNYQLTVQKEDTSNLVVRPPFTLEFDITRNTLSSSNVCQIKIYNLSENNRNQIRKNSTDLGVIRGIELAAGYGSSMPVIFKGNYTQAYSSRIGTNYITTIECFAGGFAFANSTTNQEFPAGTPKQAVITGLMNTLGDVSVGAIGNFPGAISRGASYSGPTVRVLTELTGGGFFIDNGVAHALGTNEYILENSGIQIINSASGLLGTPRLEQYKVSFDMIFEPRLTIGTQIQLLSSTEKAFNGTYKCVGVKHRGMISEAVCGEVVTTGEFFYTKSAMVGVLPYGN